MATRTRKAVVSRETRETRIQLELTLDAGEGTDITTGVGFFDHMLEQLARHGSFGLKVACTGDLHVDDHHTVEDVGIALGMALKQALGDCAGIARYGHAVIPMDESLVMCAVDISGRGLSVVDLTLTSERVGQFASEMALEFMRALAMNAGITLHIRKLAGGNAHHVLEAAFKSLGRALAAAVAVIQSGGPIPSTKGVL